MSATMARQGRWVRLEQSNLRLAMNMANMAKEVLSRAANEEMQQLIKKPRAEGREQKKWRFVFPEDNQVTAAIERHLAMVQENQMDGCLPCQNGTAKNPQTRWRRKGTSAPPPRLVLPRPGSPPAPPDDSERTQSSETEGMPPGYVYVHTPLPSARFSNLVPYAKDHMRNKDFIPYLLTGEGPSTG